MDRVKVQILIMVQLMIIIYLRYLARMEYAHLQFALMVNAKFNN